MERLPDMSDLNERTRRSWNAMRGLCERHGAGVALVADAARLTPGAVARRARQEGWATGEIQARDGAAQTLSQRIGALADTLVAEIEAIARDGSAGGYDKARIEAVSALTRALEKAGEIREARVERQQEQKKTDAELAECLGRMEDRIIELARLEADRLVAEELSRRDGGDGRR